MNTAPFASSAPDYAGWPRFWRLTIIALGVLILCACSEMPRRHADLAGIRADGYANIPPEAFTGGAGMPGDPGAPGVVGGPPGMEKGVPVPYTPTGPWAPPGIGTPWPPEEYLRDGGHNGPTPTVGRQGEVRGLDMEDTVAQFKTLDGQNHVQPSNPVYLYSPRFGAVRQVVNLEDDIQIERLSGVHEPVRLSAPVLEQTVGTKRQKTQTGLRDAALPAVAFRGKVGFGETSATIGPSGFQDRFKAYENSAAIRQGMLDETQSAWLARNSQAALAWEKKQAVQVVLDGQSAMAEKMAQGPGEVFLLNGPSGPARLRIIKVASTPFAEPGDEVDFTIRFDNVGSRTITDVAILDNLSTRLEYIPDSAQCSLAARFATQPNEGESLVIRCRLDAPLKPGQGGVIRFHCRVR